MEAAEPQNPEVPRASGCALDVSAGDEQAGMFLIGPPVPPPIAVEEQRTEARRLGVMIISQGIAADAKMMHRLAAIIEQNETQYVFFLGLKDLRAQWSKADRMQSLRATGHGFEVEGVGRESKVYVQVLGL